MDRPCVRSWIGNREQGKDLALMALIYTLVQETIHKQVRQRQSVGGKCYEDP